MEPNAKKMRTFFCNIRILISFRGNFLFSCMKYLILSLSAVLLFAASCTKVTTPVTQQDWLRSGKWKITSAKAINKSVAFSISSTYADTTLYQYNSCNADNYLVFGANYGGTLYTGGNKCYASEPDNESFYWELVNNGNNLNIYNADVFFGTTSVVGKVTNFSRNNFTLAYSYYITLPDPTNSFRTVNDTIAVTANFSNN